MTRNRMIQSTSTTKRFFLFKGICLVALASFLIWWMMKTGTIFKSPTDLARTRTDDAVDSFSFSFSLHWGNLWEDSPPPKTYHPRSKDDEQEGDDKEEDLNIIHSDEVLLISGEISPPSSSYSTNMVAHLKSSKRLVVAGLSDYKVIDTNNKEAGNDSDVKPYSLVSKSWKKEEDHQNPSKTTPGEGGFHLVKEEKVNTIIPTLLHLPIENKDEHMDRQGGIFNISLWKWMIQVIKRHFTELMSKNGGGDDDDGIDYKKLESKYTNKEDDKDKGGSYLRVVSSNLGGHRSKMDQDREVEQIMQVSHRRTFYDILSPLSFKKKKKLKFTNQNPSSSTALQRDTLKNHDSKMDDYYTLPLDVIYSNRVLQTNVCSNITDTFKTTYVIIVTGNKSLITEEQTNLLGVAFATSYNEQTSNGNGGAGGTATTTCDPLFRRITEVQVTTNAGFTGYQKQETSENILPMIPVRKLHDHLQDQPSLVDGILWESLLEFRQIDSHSKNWLDRQLQQQQEQQSQFQSQSGLNGTVRNFDIGFILFDIFGSCRGCQGDANEFNLFDDTSVIQQQERYLQDDQVTNTDCVCPVDSSTVASTVFESSFNSKVEDFRDSGEIDFVEDIVEYIPADETKCPTMGQNFSAVVLVSGLVFSESLLLSLGLEGVQLVESHFRDSYNDVAQQLCDPKYRAISKSYFVSIESEAGGSTTVQMEFVIEATCRGDDCTIDGCIFNEASSCRGNRRERKLESNIGHPGSFFAPNDDSIHNDKNIIRPPRLLQDQDENDKKDDEGERCLCRKGRSKRPPTQNEFKIWFQARLDQITENNKLSSCQACSFPGACTSGVCLVGQCAEADTQLLLNSCSCSNNEECESGFCKETSSGGITEEGEDMLPSGICQGKLASCRACNEGDDCLSGFCTEGRCAEALDGKLKTECDCISNLNCQTGRCVGAFIGTGVLGKCNEKIRNTCTEPCFVSNDCESGLCGSVVCMPVNGTLLPDGCSAALNSDCNSGKSENNLCTPATSHSLSFQPSGQPSTPPTTRPTFQPSGQPSIPPTPGPTFQPSGQPSTPPTTGPTFQPSPRPSSRPTILPTLPPSLSPTTSPSIEPTITPTISPSIFPSSIPSTSFPSVLPSRSPSSFFPSIEPTMSPTISPSISPSSSPSTSFPSVLPPPSPSASPSAYPSSAPSVLEDCRTFPANTYAMVDVYSFCNSHIGEECCTGNDSCIGWNLASTYTICKNSCKEQQACFGIAGYSSGAIVNIGVGSCQEENSCLDIASKSDQGVRVTIGTGSCIGGINACNRLFGRQEVFVDNSSCIGQGACSSLGFPGNGGTGSSEVFIGVPGISVDEGACSGIFACSSIYVGSPTGGNRIYIQSSACNEAWACSRLGQNSVGDIFINSYSCSGTYACRYFAQAAFSIEISNYSCQGFEACLGCGTGAYDACAATGVVVIQQNESTCPFSLPDNCPGPG